MNGPHEHEDSVAMLVAIQETLTTHRQGTAGLMAYALAALERVRVVGVLDGWQYNAGNVGHTVQSWTDRQQSWVELCDANSVIRQTTGTLFSGATPDEARAKAAAAIEAGEV